MVPSEIRNRTMRFEIINTIGGVNLGIYEANSVADALDAMARDAGYADYAAACDVAPVSEGELEITEISA
jgi:hypothetical protein